MEENPIKQAFGSPGGKTRLASRIVEMMPEHRIYVEPFAGGAAVYFRKGASEKEVLNDKDANISYLFTFLRDMTPKQYEWLQKQNWVGTRRQFEKLKKMQPKNDVERFYKEYYIKWASFGSGGGAYSPWRDGARKEVNSLWKVHERLKNTRVHNKSALQLISKYDSPNTLFYLDPPYPDRAFIGSTFGEYTIDDLMALVKELKGIKGKFILSLGTEHSKYMPESWSVKRLKLRRAMPQGEGGWNEGFQYEITATNFDPDKEPKGELVSDVDKDIPEHKSVIKTKHGKRVKRKCHYKPPTTSLAGMRG